MINKNLHKRLWTSVPPWIFIGAVAVLFPIFAFMTVQNINRQKENGLRLLLEKGAALIRSFEAGTRTGMGMQWSGFQLQKLLTETAQQSDILYLLVTDINGNIMVHNDPAQIGKIHGKGLDLIKISRLEPVQWRILSKTGQKKNFEVFRRFTPADGPMGMRHGHMMMELWLGQGGNRRISITPAEFLIYVGLDMSSIDDAIKSDSRHAVIMGVTLLLIGFAGFILLFLAQSYSATKTTLSRIKAFSDNVVENMPIGLVALDDHQRITSFNHVAGSVLSLSYGEVIGKGAEQVLPTAFCKILNGLNLKNRGVEQELDCPLHQGKEIPLEVSATLLHDESGTFLGYLLLFKDLSEVRSLRKEIARSQRLASLGMLAAGVSHEIRNPLSSIKGFATYFKERYHDKPEDQHIAKLMIQEVDRLNRVVGQLHEFSRPVSIIKKPVQVKTFIADSLKLIEQQASASNINIQTDPEPETDEVFIDPDRINQVLLNLYLNAIEAMDTGGSLSVETSFHKDKQLFEIRITDTGTGISKDDLTHIFDPYFTTNASGTGLGLAIVHNIIEAHDGEIKVESRAGHGTTFIILLPGAHPDNFRAERTA
ncbi:MAG: PAS domain-containing protein [Proteobacteria bacterium]|nr:PAS domain-containing protein [Pseudomonadota bacterium]